MVNATSKTIDLQNFFVVFHRSWILVFFTELCYSLFFVRLRKCQSPFFKCFKLTVETEVLVELHSEKSSLSQSLSVKETGDNGPPEGPLGSI